MSWMKVDWDRVDCRSYDCIAPFYWRVTEKPYFRMGPYPTSRQAVDNAKGANIDDAIEVFDSQGVGIMIGMTHRMAKESLKRQIQKHRCDRERN